MDKIEQLKMQMESLRDQLSQLLDRHNSLHAQELIQLSDQLHQMMNEYYKLLGLDR
ncbi:Spo0E family sporulation regulatory protein-aspartic acid phosphatase [Thermotalea metallivorans]|uniref:Spo0E like sporulation regulatory protein n=1 Tax=Thermotalea metallivorans TaxID=520762 RepID=A0A140L000_9FIRM|nr:Spo0E family sporulation regulatory protein-aspartic acid phosphatase [Thermotalea metallivorans]KXG73875.1 hypothetical protein AN619_27950 [Thermotalea metallivorans]